MKDEREKERIADGKSRRKKESRKKKGKSGSKGDGEKPE